MATTELDREAPARAGRQEWAALVVLALPLLLVSMDVSILYFAVPQISRDLEASPTQQLWIFDVYGFVLAGLLITMGALADRVGARRLLLAGAVAFSATSLFAAYADSPGRLILARAVLGIAGASLMPSTLAMVRTLFEDPAQRARAVAAWTAVMTAGVGLGPVLSGVLLEHFWWGSVFLVNLPAMALLLALGPVLLPRGEVRRGARFDLLGSALSLATVLPVVYGIKEWAAHGADPARVGAIVVGLLLGVVLVRHLLVHDHPLVPAALLRNRGYRAAVLGNAVATFALVGNAVFMTGYLQLVLGLAPLEAALWSLAPTVAVGAAAPASAALARRQGPATVGAGGFGLAAAGFTVLARVGTDSLLLVLVGAGLLAAGLVGVMSVASERVLSAVRPEEAGAGAATSESATELGGALGIAVLGSIGTAGYHAYAADHLPMVARGGPAADSLPGALAVAAGQPWGPGALAVARHAYVHGLAVAALAGAVVMVVAAIGCLLARRG